jgi:hypothetical protein
LQGDKHSILSGPFVIYEKKSFITLSPEEDYRYTAHRDDSYDIANITTYNKNHCNYDLVRRKSYRLMAGAKCSR